MLELLEQMHQMYKISIILLAKFSEISFRLDVPFITGDEVVYKPN